MKNIEKASKKNLRQNEAGEFYISLGNGIKNKNLTNLFNFYMETITEIEEYEKSKKDENVFHNELSRFTKLYCLSDKFNYYINLPIKFLEAIKEWPYIKKKSRAFCFITYEKKQHKIFLSGSEKEKEVIFSKTLVIKVKYPKNEIPNNLHHPDNPSNIIKARK